MSKTSSPREQILALSQRLKMRAATYTDVGLKLIDSATENMVLAEELEVRISRLTDEQCATLVEGLDLEKEALS